MKFRVTGMKALIMNNPASMLLAKPTGVTTKQEHDPIQEAESGAYRLPDGQLYFPKFAFRRALIDAAKGRKAAGSRVGLNTQIQGSVMIDEPLECPLVHPESGEPLHDYEPLVVTCVLPGQKVRVVRGRPKVWPWQTEVEFISDDRVSDGLIEEVFGLAGASVGVGNWRPQKGGIYGRFTVERV